MCRILHRVRLTSSHSTSPAASLVSAGGSLSFECKQDLGAVLLLNHPAMGQSIPTKRHIVTYLRRHIDSIYEYATGSPDGLGFDLKMHDIKFVSGTLKTTKWACAVMYGSYRNKMGSLNANVAGVGGFDMRVSIGDQIIPNEFYNNGPPSRSVGATPRPSVSEDRLLPGGGDVARVPSSSSQMPPGCDQCIFFHYFALKRRFFPLPHKLEAGAGPHELPPEDPAMEGNSPVQAITARSSTEYDIQENPSNDGTVSVDYQGRKHW